MDKKQHVTDRALPLVLIVGGIIGSISSLALSLDKIALLENPHYKPICNINPIFSCTDVANTHQAAIFGPPNMFIGIGAFAVVVTIGVVMLAGAVMRPWFWRALNLGLLAGMCFVLWLMVQSIFVIGALCVYCMMVWIVMPAMFGYVTRYNIVAGNLPTHLRLKRLTAWLVQYHNVILVSWYVLAALVIVQRFWSFFRTIL